MSPRLMYVCDIGYVNAFDDLGAQLGDWCCLRNFSEAWD